MQQVILGAMTFDEQSKTFGASWQENDEEPYEIIGTLSKIIKNQKDPSHVGIDV
jgi:hypothetical protein